MPTYRPLYNRLVHGKATPNSAGYQPKGKNAAVRMANLSNSWPAHRDLSSGSDEDKERLYTSARLGTRLEVRGDEETGDRHHGNIVVTSEFATTIDHSQAPY